MLSSFPTDSQTLQKPLASISRVDPASHSPDYTSRRRRHLPWQFPCHAMEKLGPAGYARQKAGALPCGYGSLRAPLTASLLSSRAAKTWVEAENSGCRYGVLGLRQDLCQRWNDTATSLPTQDFTGGYGPSIRREKRV